MKNSDNLSGRLNAQLDKEYRALVDGDLTAIEALSADKLSILEAVEELPQDQLMHFKRLREKLVRNQILMQSALEGMRSAIERARAIHGVATSLRTYTASGQPKNLAMSSGTNLSTRS